MRDRRQSATERTPNQMKHRALTIEEKLKLFNAGKAFPSAPVNEAEEARADAAYAECEARWDNESERGSEMLNDVRADR